MQITPHLRSSVLVDQMTPETLPEVAAAGYQMAMTLQEGKTSVAEWLDLLDTNPVLAGSLILNSDGAHQICQPFMDWVSTYHGLASEQQERLLIGNAARFFGSTF